MTHWYRRLEMQLWLWAVLPLTLVLVAISLNGVYSHQVAMRDFVAERDVALARLYARHIEDALTSKAIQPDGAGLAELLAEIHTGPHAALYVSDDLGQIIYHPDPASIGQLLDTSDAGVHQALTLSSGTITARLLGHAESLLSFAAVAGSRWHVLLEEPVSEVIVPILQFASVLPALIVSAGVISVIILYFSVRTIARPLQRLADQASHITGGDFSGLQERVGGVEEIQQLQSALRDMVERIRRYQVSLRHYIEGITMTQESERARLSRELHDEVVQDVVGVAQHLQLAQRSLERGEATAVKADITTALELCQTTLDDLRRTVRALRPIYLEDLGFVPALEALLRDARDAGIAAELQIQGEPRRLRSDLELAAFRVAQEALANTVRHSGAQHIQLLLGFSAHELQLEVNDDGKGFSPAGSPDLLTQDGHFGLVGMRERILLVGGKLDVVSEPGHGTRVMARFPLSD
jgi:signal transduction histidine kinase